MGALIVENLRVLKIRSMLFSANEKAQIKFLIHIMIFYCNILLTFFEIFQKRNDMLMFQQFSFFLGLNYLKNERYKTQLLKLSGNFFLRIITNGIFQISLMKFLRKDKQKLIVLVKKQVFGENKKEKQKKNEVKMSKTKLPKQKAQTMLQIFRYSTFQLNFLKANIRFHYLVQHINVVFILRIYKLSLMQNLPLNLPKLKHLISSGLAALPIDKKHQNAILVLGDTGVGKTTILSYLGNKKLVVRMHGINAVLDGQGERLGIGHDRLSETRVPSKVIIDDLVFFDCAGFGDNRGEEVEISNSFFVKRLFSLYKNVKILLMIDEHSVSQARASKLPKLVRKLLHSFQNLKDIQDGVVLVINRAKPGYNETDYCDELVKIAHLKTEGQYMFKAQQRAFIEHLVERKRVSLFFQAEKQQEGKPLQQKPNKMLELIRDTNYVHSKKIKNIISEGAKLAIREMIDEFGNEAEKKIEKLCSNMVKEIVMSCRKGFGGNLAEAMKAKQTVVELIKNISESKNDELIDMMREKIPTVDFTSLHQDIAAVMFFNNIYPRADEYFNSLKAKMSGKLSQTLMELDSEIMILQQHEKEMNQLKIKCQTLEHRNSELSEKVHTCERKNFLIETEKNQLSGQVETLQHKMGEMSSQKDAQIDSLAKSLQELQINNKSLEEELSLLNIQNESIRGELLEHQKMETESMASVCSKSSKYPEVICPHFLNGGKCRHCIKQWKDEQKKFKKQMKQNQAKLNN